MVEVRAISAERGYVERSGRKKGDLTPRLETLTIRVIPEDREALEQMGYDSARSTSFLGRVALHMFVEAYRRNPFVVRAVEE